MTLALSWIISVLLMILAIGLVNLVAGVERNTKLLVEIKSILAQESGEAGEDMSNAPHG